MSLIQTSLHSERNNRDVIYISDDDLNDIISPHKRRKQKGKRQKAFPTAVIDLTLRETEESSSAKVTQNQTVGLLNIHINTLTKRKNRQNRRLKD